MCATLYFLIKIKFSSISMFTFIHLKHKGINTDAMIQIHSPSREEIKSFLKKIESRIRRNELRPGPDQKFESRL